MENFNTVFSSVDKKIKKMYTKYELATIINNCNSTLELMKTCAIIRMLVFYGDIKKSHFLKNTADARFRTLENLKL